MHLLSVNISEPIDIDVDGKTVRTGILKQPESSAVFVSQFNLEGDGQADLVNHGGEYKAVYGLSANHYDYWRQQLAMPNLAFGQFGENLSISDLDEKTLCIGDHIQIGDCVLEVSQPRVPCAKLGYALNIKTMPKLFIQHGFTGIYFKVITTGTIRAGMKVERMFNHPEHLPVYDLFNAYFNKDFTDAQKVMRRAQHISALADEWREKVLSRL
jgi:MOSC domain-containing protein YiiM